MKLRSFKIILEYILGYSYNCYYNGFVKIIILKQKDYQFGRLLKVNCANLFLYLANFSCNSSVFFLLSFSYLL